MVLEDPTNLIKLHGTMMVAAWIFTATIGTVLARYFKKTWTSYRILGEEVWYFYHRICMFLTWTLTVIGFIIIFVDLEKWVTTTHAVIGVLVTALCLLLPLAGIMRPAHLSHNRVYFNWGHGLGGSVAYILAIVNIFLAIDLDTKIFPDWMYAFISIFTAIHIACHILYMYMRYKGSDMLPASNSFLDEPFSKWRQIVLMVHVAVAFTFSITLIIIIWMSPFD